MGGWFEIDQQGRESELIAEPARLDLIQMVLRKIPEKW